MADWEIKPASGLTPTGRAKRKSKKKMSGTLAHIEPARVPAPATTVEVLDPLPVDSGQAPSAELIAVVTQTVLANLMPQLPVNAVEDRGHMVSVRSEPREVAIDGEKFQIDAPTLMRIVRHLTQSIGEYKRRDHIYARYVIPALRKARGDVVSDLEKHFGIKWELKDGRSVFFT